MTLGPRLQTWWRTDSEQGYGPWMVPRAPGSGALPWLRVAQKQEVGHAEVDSGGGGAG